MEGPQTNIINRSSCCDSRNGSRRVLIFCWAGWPLDSFVRCVLTDDEGIHPSIDVFIQPNRSLLLRSLGFLEQLLLCLLGGALAPFQTQDCLLHRSPTRRRSRRRIMAPGPPPGAAPPTASHHHHDDAPPTSSFDPRLFAKLAYLCVQQVPRGRVATYGLIARLCHHPRHSRHVGKALRALPGAWLLLVCLGSIKVD